MNTLEADGVPNDQTIKPIESFFREDLVRFLHALNEARDCESAYQHLLALGQANGFPVLVYEYCHDYTRPDETIFLRTNLPRVFQRMEELFGRGEKVIPGRLHARDNLTMGVSGMEFVEVFSDFPEFSKKLRLAKMMTGLRSGFGIPLRTPNPVTRAGFGFASQMKRDDFLQTLNEHGTMLCVAAWHAHMKILQLQSDLPPRLRLTPKQREYLDLLCEGLLDKQISHRMKISHSGVRKHQLAIARKFGVTQRAQIVSEALRLGYTKNGSLIKNPEHDERLWDLKISL